MTRIAFISYSTTKEYFLRPAANMLQDRIRRFGCYANLYVFCYCPHNYIDQVQTAFVLGFYSYLQCLAGGIEIRHEAQHILFLHYSPQTAVE